MIERPEDLTREERDALQRVSDAIQLASLDRPRVARRAYSAAEVWPGDVLYPETIREIVQAGVRGLERAEELEAFAVGRLKVGGVEFLSWEACPEVLK